MLIRCPTCFSDYELPPDLLTAGLVLRCAHCRDAWAWRSEADTGAQISVEAHFTRSDAAPPSAPPPPRHPRRPPTSAAAWLSAAALAAGCLAAVAGKARVVAAFPPSEAVFATLGLPVNLSGLSFGDVRSTVVSGDGPPTLTLEGRITNLRHEATPVPELRIAVRDKGGRELYHWTAPAPKARLASGETTLFRSRLVGPPRDGQDLAVSFAEDAPRPRRLAEALPGDR